MARYRTYFVQKNNAPAGWRSFEGESDREANDYALGLFVGYPHAEKVEVWDNSRLTLSYSRSGAQAPTEMHRLCYLALEAARKEPDPKIKQMIASCAAKLAQEAEALERRANLRMRTVIQI
jgi:hypothetical protein